MGVVVLKKRLNMLFEFMIPENPMEFTIEEFISRLSKIPRKFIFGGKLGAAQEDDDITSFAWAGQRDHNTRGRSVVDDRGTFCSISIPFSNVEENSPTHEFLKMELEYYIRRALDKAKIPMVT
jgi:hypothetical protein